MSVVFIEEEMVVVVTFALEVDIPERRNKQSPKNPRAHTWSLQAKPTEDNHR